MIKSGRFHLCQILQRGHISISRKYYHKIIENPTLIPFFLIFRMRKVDTFLLLDVYERFVLSFIIR